MVLGLSYLFMTSGMDCTFGDDLPSLCFIEREKGKPEPCKSSYRCSPQEVDSFKDCELAVAHTCATSPSHTCVNDLAL